MRTYFEQTDTVLFTGGHYAYNTASDALLKQLGFVYEGVEHKAMRHAERGPTDLVCYSAVSSSRGGGFFYAKALHLAHRCGMLNQ